MINQNNFFPVRHLSPSASWHLIKYLDKVNPDIVLIEGPSDANSELDNIASSQVKPPIAILGYTKELPIKTILYPLAEYSPEYQAIKWAKYNKKEVRFIDLPTSTFLALEAKNLDTESNESIENRIYSENTTSNIYKEISKLYGVDYDTFWERNFEHNLNEDSFRLGMLNFGENLRSLTESKNMEDAQNVVREAFMKAQIEKAIDEGYKLDKIVVITGAYHTSNILNENTTSLTKQEITKLPSLNCNLTLMPYSYYRLSNRSGYGAGNKSPYYFEMMWEYMTKQKLDRLPQYYMACLVDNMRKEGHIKSSAEVIEAIRLAIGLSNLHDGSLPTLQDLRDGAKTCLGEGSFSKIANAVARVEIGTKIGYLPEGISNTALQNNFNHMLKDLKLEKYKTIVSETIALDLRENRRVKTEKAAFLDLNRSFFLHQLEVLGISFVSYVNVYQNNANWKEQWNLCWRPETEIELVESALYGDTVELAAAYKLKEDLDKCDKIEEVSLIITKCYECGISKMVEYASNILQKLSISANALNELAEAAFNISYILRFGSIRKIELEVLKPIISQLFFKASLIMADSADCNNEAAKIITEAIEKLDKITTYNADLVDTSTFITELTNLSNRDDRNPIISGMACSILLERGLIDNDMLVNEISRRLLPGIPADIGAGWFEGLAKRNRYIILSNMVIWEKLDNYIISLNSQDLKQAVVFLHRTFSEFSPAEKHTIAENLANIWNIDSDDLSEYLNRDLSEAEMKMLKDLEDYDFDNL